MNDTLDYFMKQSGERVSVANKLTFSMFYFYNERYLLPLSHDEVVHGKKSLLDKMPGSYEDKFANNRAFLGYMMAHPGKKLTFMSEEFGQFREWDYNNGVEFFMLSYPMHKALQVYYKDLNLFYKNTRAFYSIDDSWAGFEWINADDRDNNLLSFKRKGDDGSEIIVIISFNGIAVNDYKIKASRGKYKVVFTSDDKKYGGENALRKKTYIATKGRQDKIEGFKINVPKLSCIYIQKIN
jgi:1,4-alpha-glucan branching enzyme